jgi:hypothetical protein
MNNVTERLAEACTFENGRVKSVDFSRLFILSRSSDPPETAQLMLARSRGKKSTDLANLLAQLFPDPTIRSTALVPRNDLCLVRATQRPEGTAAPFPSAVKLESLPQQTYSIEKPAGTRFGKKEAGLREHADRFEVDLPFGMPRFITASTLKALLGAGISEVLLQKCGPRWKICSNAQRIDLQDGSQTFRLGQIEIRS